MAASPFFEAMLKSHNFKEANSNVIPLPGKMPAAIKFMVDYIKSGFMAPIPGKLGVIYVGSWRYDME